MIYINMFHLKKRRLWFKRSDWWMWEKQTNHWTKLKMKVFCVCFYHFYANKSSTKAFILPVRWRFLLMQINVDLSSRCCLFICWFECFSFWTSQKSCLILCWWSSHYQKAPEHIWTLRYRWVSLVLLSWTELNIKMFSAFSVFYNII